MSSHNLRKTFATRLLSRGAAITDVQHLLGHASVKTTEKVYAAFVKNERFKQTIDLLDQPMLPTDTDIVQSFARQAWEQTFARLP